MRKKFLTFRGKSRFEEELLTLLPDWLEKVPPTWRFSGGNVGGLEGERKNCVMMDME